MIERYTRAEMGALWTEEARYQSWLRVELAVCEAYARRGRIPADAMARIRQKARVDIARILAIQERVKHEMHHGTFLSMDAMLAAIDTVRHEEVQALVTDLLDEERLALTTLGPLDRRNLPRELLHHGV